MKKLVSIIIPTYNEEANLPELKSRLIKTIDGLQNISFEIVLIDNASSDRSFEIAKTYAAQDSRWRCYRFSRNFGAEASLSAGLSLAKGDAVIILFSDLQEPPELIPTLIDKWLEGNDVVYGVLENRADDKWYKRGGALLAYRLIHWLSDIKIPINATDYRLLSRNCVDALNLLQESNRYLRGLVHWVGFKQTTFTYKRDARKHGRSTTNFRFLFYYLTNAVVSFSTKPLDIASIVGLFTTTLSIILAAIYISLHVLSGLDMVTLTPPPAGWTTQTLAILFFGGLNCLFLGIIGKYLAKIYDEVRKRPLSIIAESYPSNL